MGRVSGSARAVLSALRRIALSVPALSAAGLFALYLLIGFFAAPAIVKWQVEKQVPAKLGHKVSLGEVRFNPFTFRFDAADFVLSDPEGRPLLGAKRVHADFELRSAIDGTWTFEVATLDSPVVNFALDKDGRHNFTRLIERLRDPAADPDRKLPRFVLRRVVVANARIEHADALLDEPLVARVEPLTLKFDELSSLPGKRARYRLEARTEAGAKFEASGELGLDPLAFEGKLTLSGLEVKSLARALSRLVALDAPVGTIEFSAGFDLAAGARGAITGSVSDIGFAIRALSVKARGASAPVLALESVEAKGGRVDFAKREIALAGMVLAKGRIAATLDAEGRLDWAGLARKSAASTREQAPPAAAKDTNEGFWRVSVASASIANVTAAFVSAAESSEALVTAFDASVEAQLGGPLARVVLGKPRVALGAVRAARGPDTLSLPAALVAAGRVALAAGSGRVELEFDAPGVTLPEGLAARQGEAALALASASMQGTRLILSSTGSTVNGSVDELKIAAGGIAWSAPAQGAQVRELSLGGRRLALKSAANGVELGMENPRATLAALQVQQGKDGLEAQSVSLAGETLSAAQAHGRVRISGTTASVSAVGVASRQGAERLALQDAALSSRALAVAAGGAAGLQARLEDAAARVEALQIAAQGASGELARARSASLAAKTLTFALAAGPFELSAEGITAALADAAVRHPADATELAKVESARLTGGTLVLKDRVFTAGEIAAANGMVKTGIDARGRFNWLAVFGAPPAQGPAKAAAPAAKAPASAPWRIAVKSAKLDGFALAFEDRRKTPVFPQALEARALGAAITGLDTASKAPAQVAMQAELASGGQLAANGTVSMNDGASDLNITASAVALAPLQSYLSEFAKLRLESGTATAQGRLRYGVPDAGAKLAWEGAVAIDRVLLEEPAAKRPFLAWDTVASGDVVLTLAPNRLDIGELRVEQPVGRLIIAQDQSVNLADVLVSRQHKDGRPAAPGAAKPKPQAPGDAFPVTIARVSIIDGVLEFADFSLRPPFAARMHELQGVITGLGTDRNSSAQLQLDARVDKFGSAKIRGQVSVREPERMTDIDMAFRNLDVTALSPYVAKFAGYRVTSGRLALDLHYRVEDSKLLGENKIVLRQFELGERIAGPHAFDLPLELAIAVLQDSDGVINVEVPVRGDLNDPEFDYGAVIGKAIGNLLGAIVTAPFRMLAALFGGGSDKALDSIDFDPGSDTIRPPERQKLEAIARALKERPALKLVVPPAYATEEDTAALKSLRVRSDIVRNMGVKLRPGEDPGPVDAANPRVQRAIERAFSERYAPEVLPLLKRRAIAEAAPVAQGTAPAEASPAAKPPAPAAPPPEFYQALVDRLILEEPVSDAMLSGLAARRGEGIVRELVKTAGVPPARVTLGEVREAAEADERAVKLRLELELTR